MTAVPRQEQPAQQTEQAAQNLFSGTVVGSVNYDDGSYDPTQEEDTDTEGVDEIAAAPTAAPTMVPVVTVAPPALVTPVPADPLLSQSRSALMTAATVLGGLFACALVLFAVSTVVRLRKKSKSKAAYDHLDLAERRDYTEPADDEFDDADEITEPAENARKVK